MTGSSDVYSHGHHESVVRSHSRRTAQNSAGYLLDFLRPGQRLLDVGCGPGTITLDLSERVRPGSVIGIDNADEPLHLARLNAADRGDDRVTFASGDVYALDFADDTFDIVHAHQVLQHLGDPVAAFKEMRRVTKPGGLVAARDADYAAMTWFPPSDALTRWLELYSAVARSNGAEPDAGRRLLSWALAAGFDKVDASASSWCYATEETRTWWGESWAERILRSDLATQALERGLSNPAELETISAGWRHWSKAAEGWFAILNGEIRCWKTSR